MNMYPYKHINHAYDYYVGDLAARVVAESGRPEDRFHLGKLILRSLRDAPDHVLQIDAATGESETNRSILERSARCARAFKKLGMGPGDIIMTLAPNHLDLSVPYYAALFTGVTVAPINENPREKELLHFIGNDKPKLVFCQSERVGVISWALDQAKVDAKIVAFDKNAGEIANCISFKEFLDNYGDSTFEKFKASDFDPEDTLAVLVGTGGTTGLPKQAMLTHKNIVVSNYTIWTRYSKFPTPTKKILFASSLQWLSAIILYNCSALLRITRVQSSRHIDQEHAYNIFNTYKPTILFASPTMLNTWLKPTLGEKVDFSSLDTLIVGGTVVSPALVSEMKQLTPRTEVINAYGMTEVTGLAFIWDNSPPESHGRIAPHLQCRLVDPDTNKVILKPNVSGELWMTGPSQLKGYYGNPEATEETFAQDGDGNTWVKSGDICYRDENWNFYFADRLKLLIRYKQYQVSPTEIQNVIRSHPAVLDVAVTAVPDEECIDLPAACVVRRPGHHVTAQEIKDLVKESLPDWEQLRGGVVFLDQLPMLPTTKIDNRRLKAMVTEMKRE